MDLGIYNYKQVFPLHEHVKVSWDENSSLCVGLSYVADSQHPWTPLAKFPNSPFNYWDNPKMCP